MQFWIDHSRIQRGKSECYKSPDKDPCLNFIRHDFWCNFAWFNILCQTPSCSSTINPLCNIHIMSRGQSADSAVSLWYHVTQHMWQYKFFCLYSCAEFLVKPYLCPQYFSAEFFAKMSDNENPRCFFDVSIGDERGKEPDFLFPRRWLKTKLQHVEVSFTDPCSKLIENLYSKVQIEW